MSYFYNINILNSNFLLVIVDLQKNEQFMKLKDIMRVFSRKNLKNYSTCCVNCLFVISIMIVVMEEGQLALQKYQSQSNSRCQAVVCCPHCSQSDSAPVGNPNNNNNNNSIILRINRTNVCCPPCSQSDSAPVGNPNSNNSIIPRINSTNVCCCSIKQSLTWLS